MLIGAWAPVRYRVQFGASFRSTLLNSHHLILDTDAAVALLDWPPPGQDGPSVRGRGGGAVAPGPSASELTRWAATARSSFARAFLHNVTIPGTGPVTCGSAPERAPITLSCGPGRTISRVLFAGYGLRNGTCTAGFHPNTTCYHDVSPAVAAACLGKPACSIECDPVYPKKRVCAGASVPDPCGGVVKRLSVSVACAAAVPPSLSPQPPHSAGPLPLSPQPPHSATAGPIAGLAFRDLDPPASCQPQAQTEAASGMAAMDLAPVWVITEAQRAGLGEMLAALATNHNGSSPQTVTVTGGIIDMNHLAPELIRHGHPDVAFGLLAADGYPSLYHMARYGGTLWENWDNANGCDTPAGCARADVQSSGIGVGSLNHIMYGTFRPNFHPFDHFELDLRGHIHVRGADFSCLRLKLADIVLI